MFRSAKFLIETPALEKTANYGTTNNEGALYGAHNSHSKLGLLLDVTKYAIREGKFTDYEFWYNLGSTL